MTGRGIRGARRVEFASRRADIPDGARRVRAHAPGNGDSLSYTPPGYPGQPQQPVSPDGRWWWDGAQWRPNEANPFGSADGTHDNRHGPKPPAGVIRYTPGPPGVPNPYVPLRLPESDAGDRSAGTAPDDVYFLLAAERRSWWTPRRFVLFLAGILLAILLGIGLLFWLSIDAFQNQRDDVPPPAPTVTTQTDASLPS